MLARGWGRSRRKNLSDLIAQRLLGASLAGSGDANASSNHEKRSRPEFHQQRSSSQFLEHSLVDSDAGFEILQRKIFIRRMRPAILQRETNQ